MARVPAVRPPRSLLTQVEAPQISYCLFYRGKVELRTGASSAISQVPDSQELERVKYNNKSALGQDVWVLAAVLVRVHD